MCLSDFGLPIVQDGQLPHSSIVSAEKTYPQKVTKRRKDRDEDLKLQKRNNFEFVAFKDPTLFLGHLLDSSVLLVEKQWMDVVEGFGPPVHRHSYDFAPSSPTEEQYQQYAPLSVYINKNSEVIMKPKTKHIGGAFSKQTRTIVYIIHDDTRDLVAVPRHAGVSHDIVREATSA